MAGAAGYGTRCSNGWKGERGLSRAGRTLTIGPLVHHIQKYQLPFSSLLDRYKTDSAPEEMHEIEVECEELTDQICAILRASNPLEDAQIKDILVRVYGMRNMMTPPAQSDPKQKKWANLPPCDELRSAVYLAANGDFKGQEAHCLYMVLESVQSDIYFDMHLKP
ncbi:hypothetical protein BDP27DRAFT_1370939 [Rhodocollybia butyracea]|uniref:Uncharacterized protein n=1 Tax=Rhodocollybia butyracea TaxID=206335 RepID=A0A9P5PDA7_9AGAR|nr:hypothetical protein BDP27DRAFT_1370939 [Rhodocollybia butyracea]